MKSEITSPDDRDSFLAYPVNRVAGTIADSDDAEAALRALLDAGVGADDIEVLHGETGLRRLDPEGTEHGLLARFQRAVIHIAGANEEALTLEHHVDDVRAGRFVILVRADRPDTRDRIAAMLKAHGASFVGFFGRWTLHSLEHTQGNNQPATDRTVAGPTFAADLGTGPVTFQLESDEVIGVSLEGESPTEVVSTAVRPDVFMTTWRQRDGTIVTHVNDVRNMLACAHIVAADGAIRRVGGTLRRTN
jgi:hypothetical protein